MYRLFQFIYTYRTFFTFLIIQIFCLLIVVRKNDYHNTLYFGTTNRLVASLVSTTNYVSDFLSLREVNSELASENARLKRELSRLQIGLYDLNYQESVDSDMLNKYNFIKADVLDNSVSLTRNYITLNKGAKDGIKEEMGVVGANGIVGKIKSVSDHFSIASSMLHMDILTSASVKNNNAFGSLKWDGESLDELKLLYIPRHININIGDSIITSGFNAIFPKGVFIGKIKNYNLVDESAFFDITVSLSTDFSRLSHVYIIQNTLKQEIDSLESVIEVSQ